MTKKRITGPFLNNSDQLKWQKQIVKEEKRK
ncbi:hypothetical protein CathTA2_2452 [Caldalkalibacillus thermarum TA2.A1]|uniref:Uncharacterized protein n=1 Tax=Caldalkalibacillus thermarum (strain TA2.A1) TaxID=986075 RepID=F5L9E7_CALTT|nr:hypothetical protein CathTA2_2452 [Caldalkalibacillus thermarum TA2.A1]